jgi:hypothetical protein
VWLLNGRDDDDDDDDDNDITISIVGSNDRYVTEPPASVQRLLACIKRKGLSFSTDEMLVCVSKMSMSFCHPSGQERTRE